MKKLSVLILVIAGFTLSSCKKKTKDPEPATNDITPILVSNGNYSNLQTNKGITNYNNTIILDSAVFASFYDVPPVSTLPNTISAGNVSVNSTSLTYSGGTYYNSSSPINVTGPVNWNVAGSGTITAFTHSYVPAYPKYSGYGSLPDTCIKANGISINISGITNHINNQGVSVSLMGGSGYANKFLSNDSGTITFSASDLASFSANSPITISVLISNFTTVKLGGVNHGFSANFSYAKIAYLK